MMSRRLAIALLFTLLPLPRALAAVGMISSAWCVICAFAFIVFPHFETTVNAYWFDMPLVIFETAFGVWLLFKGLRPSGTTEPDRAPAEAA